MTDEIDTTFLDQDDALGQLARRYLAAVLTGDRRGASRLILEAAEQGSSIRQLYLQVFQPVQWEVGRLWQRGDINVAQEHLCTAVTQLVMSQLYPLVFSCSPSGPVAISTSVQGNLHQLGPSMVADFWEMDGWDSRFLGGDTPNDDLLTMLKRTGARLLGVSAALPNQVEQVADLVGAVRSGLGTAAPTILVGGRAFNGDPMLWRRIGADAYQEHAAAASEWAMELLKAS